MTLDQISGSIPGVPTKTVTTDSISNVLTPLSLLGLAFLFLFTFMIGGFWLISSSIPGAMVARSDLQFANAAAGIVLGLLSVGFGTVGSVVAGAQWIDQANAGVAQLKVDRLGKPVSFSIQRHAFVLDDARISWSLVNPATTSVIRFAEHVELRLGFRDGTEQVMKCPLKSQRAVGWLGQTMIDRATSFGTEDDVPESIQALRSTPKQPI